MMVPFPNRGLWILRFLASAVLLAGCSSPPSPGPYSPTSEVQRDSTKSDRLATEAAELLESDPKRAEELLRLAINADLYNGRAHNNLGTLHLAQGRLYEAANEFEWARKLMPGHPDPRLNLALTLEKAGRIDDAIATYATALEVYPEHIATMQALARLQVRTARVNDHTAQMLEVIALRGETPGWRDWAKLQRTRLSQ